MPYDDGLAHRIRTILEPRPGCSEREMFGGLAFMLGEDLVCAVIDDRLVARVGPEAYEEALAEPHVRPFDFTGREMRGWVYVEPAGLTSEAALTDWLDRAAAFVDTREQP